MSTHDEADRARQAREQAVAGTADDGVQGGAQAPQDEAASIQAAAAELGEPDHHGEPVGLTTAERDRTDGPGSGGQRSWDGRHPADEPLREHDRGDAWAAAGTTTDPSQAVGMRPTASSGAGGDATYGSGLAGASGTGGAPATESTGRPEPGREHLEAPPEARDAAAEAPETLGIDDTDTALAGEDTTA